ncbi:MAG: 50S ribosomal protein L24 [Gammaproteobacteria bacterium]|nr:50S ribosomal protein L24 [Gammaproteobacteria bacterium]
MNKLKKGDQVVVIAGKDKGVKGTINAVSGLKVTVDGVNIAKKHQKPNPNAQIQGGIIDKEMPLAISNVAIYNTLEQRADRVGFKILDNGNKIRVFKSTGEAIDA